MTEGERDKGFEDEDLMAAICRGDKNALDTLMARHMRTIYAFALSLCRNPEDAKDLTQETFVRCFTKAHTFKPGRVKVTTWLHVLTRNLAIDSFRKHRWMLESDVQDFTARLDNLAADDSQSPESVLGLRDCENRLRACLDDLPERQRTALLLCYYHGFSNREAAIVLGVSLDALVSLLARARRTLKAALKPEAGRDV